MQARWYTNKKYLLFIKVMRLSYKIIYLCLLQGIGILSLSAQKHDYQWLFGYGNRVASTDTNFGGIILDFNDTPTALVKHVRLSDINEDNVSYSDNNGKLLFYSNGGDIFDSQDSIMLNGDSINFGNDWEVELIETSERYRGLRIIQGMLALPAPSDSSGAYLFHYSVHLCILSDTSEAYLTDTSFYSLIDFKGNNNLGKVIKKNQVLNSDTLSYAELSAVQHGNGRDWWIIHPYYTGNCYYKFLLSDTGTGLHDIQCIGENQYGFGGIGTSCFSPNGEKYFWVDPLDSIRMFDFDRCTGELSNPQTIPFPYPLSADTLGVASSGIAISPNGRYMYIAATIMVLQYDLEAPDIGASVDTVAIWDGSYDPYPLANTFFIEQLGPDGKIYINSTNSVESLSVINQPDSSGVNCIVSQHSLFLHTYNDASMPNFPNYRLGPLHGSACDTLNTMTTDVRAEKERILKVYPNPATEHTIVDYGFTDWNQGNINMQIVDALGRVIYTQQLPMYSGYQKLNVSQFAAGMYTVFIKRNNTVVATQKLVKQ